jgi:flagellar basal-body rod protein FlgC
MSVFHGLNISGSALTAQRLRMDVVSSNIANAETTRGRLVNGEWQPYRRKMVETQAKEGQFQSLLMSAMDRTNSPGNGVKVTKISEDQSPFKLVYHPEHPDANEEGYVQLPNVDPLKEMVDLISASRSYEANVTAFNATKGMLMKALEIGK